MLISIYKHSIQPYPTTCYLRVCDNYYFFSGSQTLNHRIEAVLLGHVQPQTKPQSLGDSVKMVAVYRDENEQLIVENILECES